MQYEPGLYGVTADENTAALILTVDDGSLVSNDGPLCDQANEWTQHSRYGLFVVPANVSHSCSP
jgi:hypothetical protein